MYNIPMREVSPDFLKCWQAAIRHLLLQGQGVIHWLLVPLHLPMPAHFSFRLGNQLFFVCFEAEGVAACSTHTASSLRAVADGCRGHACVMPMRKTPQG